MKLRTVLWTCIVCAAGSVAQAQGNLVAEALATGGPNGVLEPGETAGMVPTYRNIGPTSSPFLSSSLSNFTGPAGPTYTIVDGMGQYGNILPGDSGSCFDCYSVSITAGPARPVLHWDASVVETVFIWGHTWTLHVGDSFVDVPRSSGFYRFVETLLHGGVTGGCSATEYCPAAPTTREQMAVFVLTAKEGSGYTPPACAAPNLFADVPETSPFCRWIEELATRSVVSGCGGGNYCPAAAVTREQMAIFVLRTLDPVLDPPACAPPNLFADVPETSPFCRWIEELSRRGVVSGCGGGNYCPASPVTREQMGVFLGVTFSLLLYAP